MHTLQVPYVEYNVVPSALQGLASFSNDFSRQPYQHLRKSVLTTASDATFSAPLGVTLVSLPMAAVYLIKEARGHCYSSQANRLDSTRRN